MLDSAGPIVALWHFPPADFPAWRELVGTPQVATYAEYLTLLAALEADHERQGRTVRRVRMPVAEMRSRLNVAGIANTPENRARIAGEAMI